MTTTEAMDERGLWFIVADHIGETCPVWWWERDTTPGAMSDLPKDHPVRKTILAQKRDARRTKTANAVLESIYYCGEPVNDEDATVFGRAYAMMRRPRSSRTNGRR